MNAPKLGWTALQCREGTCFLQWLQETQALHTGFDALASALQVQLKSRVKTREDAHDLWAAVPAVMSHCNETNIDCMPGYAPAYAWLHFLERYVRTWLALQLLVEQHFLPRGKEGVRALDVGTGLGPSSFATHDFYASMIEYAEFSGNKLWHQPSRLKCVEPVGAMNHFRHHLAEILFEKGAPESVLAMCGNIQNFKSIHPRQERKKLEDQLRNEHENYYDESTDEWHSGLHNTPEEANYIANKHRRYRLFTFSNFLTELSKVECHRQNLTDTLNDAQPGSVLLVIGGDYPDVYEEVATLAEETGFFRHAEDLRVSISGAEMGDFIYSEGARFYKRLKNIAGDLPTDDPNTKTVKAHFEGQKIKKPSKSAVRAYRK